jgi:hypothetical protein
MKIGIANSPYDRIKQIQTCNPKKLYFDRIYCFPNKKVAEYFENYLHEFLDFYNSFGEWFEVNEDSIAELDDAIDENHFDNLIHIQKENYSKIITKTFKKEWEQYNAKKQDD